MWVHVHYKLKIWWTFQNWHCRNTHVDYVGHISKMCHSCSFGVRSTKLTTKLLPKFRLLVHFLLTASMQIDSFDPEEEWERSPRGRKASEKAMGLERIMVECQEQNECFGKDHHAVRNVQTEWSCCHQKNWLEIYRILIEHNDWIGYWLCILIWGFQKCTWGGPKNQSKILIFKSPSSIHWL